MNKCFLLLFTIVGLVGQIRAQPKPRKDSAHIAIPVPGSHTLNMDSAYTIHAGATVRGVHFPYDVTVGTQPVWNEDGTPSAGVFFTYYERTDVKDKASRPLVVSFNGGPGTPSLWMELGYTSPRRLNISDEGFAVQPYGIKDNPYSILDAADIVYIDPVNTGFSRPANKETAAAKFYGVNADVKYLAAWISNFVSRKGRWGSPKFLVGESYGTTRAAGLALELQDAQWMYLNGIVLVSPTQLGIQRSESVSAALRFPYYAATAWYHKKLAGSEQAEDLDQLLKDVEKFTVDSLVPAMTHGGFLDEDRKKSLATRMASYSGLSSTFILQCNLQIPAELFWKELLRDQGVTVGRLDSRYKGIDRMVAGGTPDYNAELTNWIHSFTPAMNIYLRDELHYKTDLTYNIFGDVFPWDDRDDHTGENLRLAMAENPNLHLLVQSGYYDGACDYFNAKYDMWQLDPSGKLKDRLHWQGYRSGHMLYLRKEDLQQSTGNLREFILSSVPKPGEAAKF